MMSAIVDVAHTLARMLLEQGDLRGALSVANAGLAADPFADGRRTDAVAASVALGDLGEAQRINDRYDALLRELDEELA